MHIGVAVDAPNGLLVPVIRDADRKRIEKLAGELNHAPQVAILGVSRSEMAPVWNGGQFTPKLMMPLSLTYDHRVIDGADGARFLRWICEAVEEPLNLAMKG